MKKNQIIIVFLFLCLIFFVFSNGVRAEDINQQILDLRKQIEELTKQADQYKGTIAQKQKEADTLNRQITILNNQILQLQAKINITTKQISATQLEITDLEGQIYDTQQKISGQQQAIGELLSFLYERDQVGLLAMILKSPTLSSFTNEVQQTRNLNSKLMQLLTNLKVQESTLQTDKNQLNQKKSEMETLNEKQIGQQNSLSGNKQSKNTLLAQTKGQEAQYQNMLKEVEQKQSQFFNELQKLENQAIQSGAYIIHVTATYIPPKGTNIFKWPYDDYVLTQGYGCTTYARCGKPSGPYGGAPHNGVDITEGFGSAIHSAADGVILASGYNDGWGNWVAVRHPQLYSLVTLYAHMKSPSGLANGTSITTNSVIGYEGSTGNSTGSHLHISVYSDFFTYISDKSGQVYFNYFEGTLNPFYYLP